MDKLNFVFVAFFIANMLLFVKAYSDEEPNCEFETDIDKTKTPWIIEGDSISEKTAPNTTIWNKPTRNIVTSVSSYHSHTKYLTGLRYTSRYEYQAAPPFPNFVNTENSIVLHRVVQFTCQTGEVRVQFNFPLIDENDPPEFYRVPRNELSIKNGLNDVINKDEPIIVLDRDFDSKNNNVVVSSDRPDVLKVSIRDEEDLPNGIGKRFNVELRLNLDGTEPIKEGRYTLNLFANDGQFTESKEIRVHVMPNN